MSTAPETLDGFKLFYTLLGGLGIFFYGMKVMSDSIQSVAGDVIKKIINSLTSNRFFAVGVGLLVTCIIQSSSVTTVMVVGLVNAGLMNLTQAIGVIFGANIGTTITGWIISINVGKYGLLFIGLGIFPTLFAQRNKWIQIGRVCFALGMVFLGLEVMGDAFKPLRGNQAFIDALSYFSGQNYGSYIASIVMGCLLTMIVQSSSAMLGITMALASTGVLSFQTAGCLVLGENIGTTITAILASVGTNVNAKRAARAHALFNIIGVSLIVTILPYYLEFIEWLIPHVADFTSVDGTKPYIAAHIAATHTTFNVVATICFIPFIDHLAKLVTKLTPDKAVKEPHHLIVLGSPADVVPAAAILQAEKEMEKFKEILNRQYAATMQYLDAAENDTKILAKIRDYEKITDNMQKEVTIYLCVVMEKALTPIQSLHTQALIRITDEFESIADYFDRIATYKTRAPETFNLSGDTKIEFIAFAKAVWEYFELCTTGLKNPDAHDVQLCERKQEELRLWADDIRDKHLARISKGLFTPESALTYSDMVVAMRKVRAHSWHIALDIANLNREEI